MKTKTHENKHFIEELFFQQIKNLTMKAKEDSLDFQFSDAWLKARA